jgi:MYXO-CTERM domain-containing protein
MFTTITRLVAIAVVLSFGQPRLHADYLTQSVVLHSDYAGPNAGIVVAEANAGSGAAVNGLLPGQVRLTFTVNPVPAYTRISPHFGFDQIVFNSDLLITPSQIATPPGWLPSVYNGPAFPSRAIWQINAPIEGQSAVVLLFSGLGKQARLDHFLTNVQAFVPNPEFGEPPPFIFHGTVGVVIPDFEAPSLWTDTLIGDAVLATPEPSTLVLGVVGLAAAALGRRRQIMLWR